MITFWMLVWFAAAIVAHDLLLFPLYAGADRVLVRSLRRGAVNHLRLPLMASGLTFLLFLPGIVQQGSTSFRVATGLDQSPYLGRWLLLCAVFFAVSAALYAARRARRRFRARRG